MAAVAAASSLTDCETHAPILLRPRNFQWYWDSAADPWSGEEEEWQKYTDVENEIIEDAFNAQQNDVEIDGDYIVDLKQEVQYKKDNFNRQRPIKRVQLQEDRNDVYLREERFALPVALTLTSTWTDGLSDDVLDDLRKYGHFPNAYYKLALQNKNKTYADIVEAAVEGIINEGTVLDKQHEAQWLAQQLRNVKQYGNDGEADDFPSIPSEIGETCVYLYTKESFLYKRINHILRSYETVTREQIIIMGPFCWLLHHYLRNNTTGKILTVYRGFTITDELRKEFIRQKITFTAFTSTSKNRKKADQFGNALLIIDLNVQMYMTDRNVYCGALISHLSVFPNEEEFLLWPGTQLRCVKWKYDDVMKKYIFHLKLHDYKW